MMGHGKPQLHVVTSVDTKYTLVGSLKIGLRFSSYWPRPWDILVSASNSVALNHRIQRSPGPIWDAQRREVVQGLNVLTQHSVS